MTTYVPLNGTEIAVIQHLFLTVVVPTMTAEHQDEDDRSGAVLNLCDNTNATLLNVRGGTALEPRFLAYEVNASAKNDALDYFPDHKTSWQVHRGDTSVKPYPGAIRTRYDDRISISGFTWQRDTIGSLWLACKLGRTTIMDAAATANICGIGRQFISTAIKLNNTRMALAAAA